MTLPGAKVESGKKAGQLQGGIIVAKLNNGKLIDRGYQNDKDQKQEETGILKIGGGLLVMVVATMGILALSVLMGDQDW